MATSPVSSPSPSTARDSQAIGHYTYKPNGTGGVNYFRDGIPVTNAEYAGATGQDIKALEQYQNEIYNYKTKGQGSLIDPNSSVKGASTTLADTTNKGAQQPTTPTGTSGNAFNSSSYYLPPTTYLGQTYNQSDPAQLQALLQAKQNNLGGQRDQQISQINRQLGESLQNAALQQGQQLGTFNQNATDYGRGVANNIVGLGQGYDIGTVNNQQQFAGLSPNAFQSGQGTSQQYAGDQYNKGLNQLHQNLAETVGGDYLNNGSIDQNSAIGKQIAGLNQQYNMFTGDARNSAQLGIQNANNAYGTGMDQNLSNLQALYNYAGLPQFKFNSQGYNPNALPNVDISQYTPYANSSQLAGSQQAQQPSPATWTGSGNPFSGLLGYNPNATETNYLNAFLGKGNTPATATGS